MSVDINHLTFAYTQGGKPLDPTLVDLDFTIEEGSFLGIIGHTGSGKSTFVKHLNGLLTSEKGAVVVDGHDLSVKAERKTVRSLVGMVFQYPEYQLFAETVYASPSVLRSTCPAVSAAGPRLRACLRCIRSTWFWTSRWRVSIRSADVRFLRCSKSCGRNPDARSL